MFIIYSLEDGKLLYTVDEEALSNFSSDEYGSVAVPDTWRDTHFWVASEKALIELPPQE